MIISLNLPHACLNPTAVYYQNFFGKLQSIYNLQKSRNTGFDTFRNNKRSEFAHDFLWMKVAFYLKFIYSEKATKFPVLCSGSQK